MRIFGIGAHRTGLTSLAYLLKAGGYAVLPDGFGADRSHEYYDENYLLIHNLADIYHACVGEPWNLGDFYKQLAEKYDDAKFILTWRPVEEWLTSIRRYVALAEKKSSKLAHGQRLYPFLPEYRERPGRHPTDTELKERYQRRRDDVVNYFQGTDRLFVLDWRRFDVRDLWAFLDPQHDKLLPTEADTQLPVMRRWDKSFSGEFQYFSNPSVSHGEDPDNPAKMIYFTTSVWNRWTHLSQLIENLTFIARVDRNVALHVGLFDSNGVSPFVAREVIEDQTEFPARMSYLPRPFINGRGHNIAASFVPDNAILCPIAVDVNLPLDIGDRIRAAVREGQFYGPMVNNEDAKGNLHHCAYAYALVALLKRDFNQHVGKFQENHRWGGDKDPKPEGGEDVALCRKLKRCGMTEVRPFEPDLICRHHPRDISSHFYSSLHRYKKKPWWDFVGPEGEPAEFRGMTAYPPSKRNP